jgi:hypothetical protein
LKEARCGFAGLADEAQIDPRSESGLPVWLKGGDAAVRAVTGVRVG